MKNTEDTIGNRTCDIPDCSAVHQPTVAPGAPPSRLIENVIINNYSLLRNILRTFFGPGRPFGGTVGAVYPSRAVIVRTEQLKGSVWNSWPWRNA